MTEDPTRREFFRTFGRQTVRNAGTVLGAAAELRRASSDAARDILELAPVAIEAEQQADLPGPTFSSAYRLAEDGLLLLDQRQLPGRMEVIKCADASEIASAIRSGVVNAGPVLAEVAAYGLSFVASAVVDREAWSRDGRFGAAANTLRGARREVHAMGVAVERLEQRFADLINGDDPSDLSESLRAEADAVATEAQMAHAALGRAGADAISAAVAGRPGRTPGEPINLVMHGDAGPLSCGMIGTGTQILQSLVVLGGKVHVWLTEAAPGLEGARITALQLAQMDVPHTLITDSAAGWLFQSRRLDGVLLRADTICANDDTVALVGSLAVAQLAAAAQVPVYVLAPSTASDSTAPDGRSVVLDLRSPAEAMAASVGSDGHSRPAVFGVRLDRTYDVVPARFVSSFLTESGPRPGARA